MPLWEEVFTPSTPVLELLVRGTVTTLALLRLVGQRESGGDWA